MKKRKLSNFRRSSILALSFILASLSIAFGTKYYVSPNVAYGIEYGGGAEFSAEIEKTSKNQEPAKLATMAVDDIYNVVNNSTQKKVKISSETNQNGATVKIYYPGIKKSSDISEVKNNVINKPHLVFTDIYSNVLFDENQNFNRLLIGKKDNDPKGPIFSPNSNQYLEAVRKSKIPVAVNGARPFYNSLDQKHEVLVKFQNDKNKRLEWTLAARYITSLPEEKRKILVWLNLENLIQYAKTSDNNGWKSSSYNPYKYVYVDNKTDTKKEKGTLKQYQFDAAKYFIAASPITEKTSYSDAYIIKSDFNIDTSKEVASRINYAASNYIMNIKETRILSPDKGRTVFEKVKLALIIIFALLALFLILNYGLLGFISTLSLALLGFFTVMIFTAMKGELSPETIAALILGMGISLDANIIIFERLKTNIGKGDTLKFANSKTQSQSLRTIIDSSIALLLSSFILFFMGANDIKGLAIVIILALVFNLILTLGFNRLATTLLINTGVLDKHKWLLGFHLKIFKKVQLVINKGKYLKVSKWFSITSSIVVVIGLVVFSIFAGINKSASSGFNLSQAFSGGNVVSVVKSNENVLEKEEISKIKDIFINSNAKTDDIYNIYKNGHRGEKDNIIGLEIKTKNTLNEKKIEDFIKQENQSKIKYDFYSAKTNKDYAINILKKTLIVIVVALFLIIAYILIRFKWTHAIAAFLAISLDMVMMTALFLIFRLKISPEFMNIILLIFAYSTHNILIMYDRIREYQNGIKAKYLSKPDVINVFKSALKDMIKRTILLSLVFSLMIMIFLGLGDSSQIIVKVGLLIGIIFCSYSSIFIGSLIWLGFEIVRQNNIKKRVEKKFWKTSGVEEQNFQGINEFAP